VTGNPRDTEFPLLMTQEVSKVYKMGDAEVHALRDASMMVRPSEFLAVMGTSGSGKSTLLQILGCLDKPSTGRVFLEGQDVASLSDIELARIRNRKLGFVFQAFNLMPQETAADNVAVPLQYAGIGKKQRRKMAVEALMAVGLSDRVDHKPAELSGGQRQRVAIARAIVNKPLVILADEPTGALDSKSGIEVMAILQQLNEQGRTIVMVTHDYSIAQYAHRVIKLSDGSIIEEEIIEKQKQARPYVEEIKEEKEKPARRHEHIRVRPVDSFKPVPIELPRGGESEEPVICPRCNSANRPKGRFCHECGSPLNQTDLGKNNLRARLGGSSVTCDACGAENRPVASFCNTCGSSMDRSYVSI
jgi:putative ABC transport system ATP-binding protein